MSEAGIYLYPWAVDDAGHVCQDVWYGIDPDLVVDEFRMINPEWTLEQARTFVAASIVIYCPPPGLIEELQRQAGPTFQA